MPNIPNYRSATKQDGESTRDNTGEGTEDYSRPGSAKSGNNLLH